MDTRKTIDDAGHRAARRIMSSSSNYPIIGSNKRIAEIERTEKITINLGPVDLGQIDLLVQEGFYSNRTDFIRTAIRNQLATHAEVVRRTVARKTLVLGLQHYTLQDLEAVKLAGQKLQINVLGLVSIADEVSPELALETIDSIIVLGAFRAPPEVKAALAGRIK
jgi:Arc/MetJ-type ribon-helix-helix transcriptional regulator